ncbi:hypothetical protein DFH07DRAFT_784676 [Mycena maculata]|uniref:Uncharacterized protein n=1 Tax=Mycena maculata TaxID=230809 RepID=A0AAD7HG52_9AGAR|nr:hypothetical protein DFH07DRAFT_784676 [Mycena maculata]
MATQERMGIDSIDSLSLNSAERFAVRVLADLHGSVPEDAPVSEHGSTDSLHKDFGPDHATHSEVSPTMGLAEEMSSSSSSDHSLGSSKLAVVEAPTVKRKVRNGYWTESVPLPPAVSPTTCRQKWLWWEVGRLGLLTWIQEAQIEVANLTCTVSEHSEESDGDADLHDIRAGSEEPRPWSSKFVTWDLFMDIVRWRTDEGREGYDVWDVRAKQEFVEGTLLQRQYLSKHQHVA